MCSQFYVCHLFSSNFQNFSISYDFLDNRKTLIKLRPFEFLGSYTAQYTAAAHWWCINASKVSIRSTPSEQYCCTLLGTQMVYSLDLLKQRCPPNLFFFSRPCIAIGNERDACMHARGGKRPNVTFTKAQLQYVLLYHII